MAKKKTERSYHHGNLYEALLDATERLVSQNGLPAFTLREAARQVGVDPAACYRHFKGREDLLQALARRGFTALADSMEERISGQCSHEAALIELGRCYIDYAIERPALFAVMFGGSGTHALDPVLDGTPQAGRRPIDILTDTLAEWSKELRLGMPQELAPLVIWSGVHGIASLIVNGAIQMSKKERDLYIESAVKSQIRGLCL